MVILVLIVCGAHVKLLINFERLVRRLAADIHEQRMDASYLLALTAYV